MSSEKKNTDGPIVNNAQQDANTGNVKTKIALYSEETDHPVPLPNCLEGDIEAYSAGYADVHSGGIMLVDPRNIMQENDNKEKTLFQEAGLDTYDDLMDSWKNLGYEKDMNVHYTTGGEGMCVALRAEVKTEGTYQVLKLRSSNTGKLKAIMIVLNDNDDDATDNDDDDQEEESGNEDSSDGFDDSEEDCSESDEK